MHYSGAIDKHVATSIGWLGSVVKRGVVVVPGDRVQ
jgi:hypothetical protein